MYIARRPLRHPAVPVCRLRGREKLPSFGPPSSAGNRSFFVFCFLLFAECNRDGSVIVVFVFLLLLSLYRDVNLCFDVMML